MSWKNLSDGYVIVRSGLFHTVTQWTALAYDLCAQCHFRNNRSIFQFSESNVTLPRRPRLQNSVGDVTKLPGDKNLSNKPCVYLLKRHGSNSIFVGSITDLKYPTHLNLDDFSVHCITSAIKILRLYYIATVKLPLDLRDKDQLMKHSLNNIAHLRNIKRHFSKLSITNFSPRVSRIVHNLLRFKIFVIFLLFWLTCPPTRS